MHVHEQHKVERVQENKLEMFQKDIMQGFQDIFCESQNLYMAFVQRGKVRVTSFQGSEEENSFIDEVFPANLQRELFDFFADGDSENVIALDSQPDYIKICGVAVRGQQKEIAGVWLVIGVDQERIPEDRFISKSVKRTTTSQFDKSIALLELLNKTYFREQMQEFELQATVDDLKKQQDDMGYQLQKSEVLTEILKLMEMDLPFDQVTKDILAIASQYLRLSNAHLLQMHDGEGELGIVCEWWDVPEHTMLGTLKGKMAKDVPFLTGRPYTISSDTIMPQNFKDYFEEQMITCGVFLPISIGNQTDMYLCYVMKEGQRKWSLEDLNFMNDIKRIVQTILEKRISQNSLASSYAALEHILEHTGCGVSVNDLQSQTVLFTNQTFQGMDITTEDMQKLQLDLMYTSEDTKVIHNYHTRESNKYFEISFSSIAWVDGRMVRVATIYDNSENKIYQEKIERQASEDYLTGLWNRMRFEKDLEDMLHMTVRQADPSALLYIDVRDFGQMNDDAGHHIGNSLLKNVAKALEHIEGAGGHCYRIGGDEFAVLITSRHFDRKEQIISNICNQFQSPWYVDGQEYYCAMNMGVVCMPKDGISTETILKRADIALHQAKCRGKNAVEYYGEGHDGIKSGRLEVEQNLRKAVQLGCKEFSLYYQPIYDNTTEEPTCIGAEALIRWNSPSLGFVMPEQFLPLADYLGLLPEIGKRVLLDACSRCKYWNDFGHPEYTVTVNFSISQIFCMDMIGIVQGALEQTGLAPEQLVIDVTGDYNIREKEYLKQILQEIKMIGVKVSLDDFGKADVAIQSLQDMKVDMIKFDKNCVSKLGRDGFMDAYMIAAVKLANLLDVKICIKDIEWQKQARAMKEMHIHMVQGYLFDKPMTQEEFEKKYVLHEEEN